MSLDSRDLCESLQIGRRGLLLAPKRRRFGEVGLDRWIVKDEAERELQRDLFTGFVELSKELELPRVER